MYVAISIYYVQNENILLQLEETNSPSRLAAGLSHNLAEWNLEEGFPCILLGVSSVYASNRTLFQVASGLKPFISESSVSEASIPV